MTASRFGMQRYEIFVGGLLLLLSFFSFMLGVSYMAAVFMLSSLLSIRAAVARMASLYQDAEMKKSFEEAIVILALTLVAGYYAGHAEFTREQFSNILMIIHLPDMITFAPLSRLPLILIYHGLAVVFSSLFVTSMTRFSVKSGERLYSVFAYSFCISLLLLAPVFLLVAGSALVTASFAGRLRAP